MAEHDPLCLAHGYGPGQRIDLCICTGIRIGRADVAEEIAQAIEAFSGDFIADECAAIARRAAEESP